MTRLFYWGCECTLALCTVVPLDLDAITEHLRAIHQSRLYGLTASIALHRTEIDVRIDAVALPFEIRAALKSFYRSETLTQWQFYTDHVEMLLTQYGVEIIYWSSSTAIEHYSDMYMIHEMGLVDDSLFSDESEEEEAVVIPQIPMITVTQHF